MNFKRAVLLFAIVSLALSSLLYLVTPNTIKSSWSAKLAEVGTVAVVIFVFLLILYIIAKTVFKSAMAVRKKSLPKKEGPKV
ncbi:MAG: hypothetical protein V4581_08105 [Bacteroidota bacterium]